MLPRSIFTAEHEQFRDAVRRFFQQEIGVHAARWNAQGFVDRDAYLKAGAQGFLLTWAAEEYGGAAVNDLRYEQIIQEENVRHGDLCFYANLHSMIVAPYIAEFGSAPQKARFLPPAVKGETILAIAMTEPGTGSDLAAIKTRATRRGDDWVLSGSKTYISNGIQADVIVVAARTGPGHQIGLFLIEAGMQGFERGRKLHKLGLEAQDTAELFFDNVHVPIGNVLGDPAHGFKYMTKLLATERLMVGIGSLAHAQLAFEITLDFVKERRAFGKPVGAFQNTRFKLAELRTKLDAAQAFVDQCVLLANQSQLTSGVASEVKLLTSELEGVVVDECLQLHGGAGYMGEYRISRIYRDARVSRIFAGTSEIMKEVISRELGLDERKLH